MKNEKFKQGEKYVIWLDIYCIQYLYGRLYIFGDEILVIKKGNYPIYLSKRMFHKFKKMDFDTWLYLDQPLPF